MVIHTYNPNFQDEGAGISSVPGQTWLYNKVFCHKTIGCGWCQKPLEVSYYIFQTSKEDETTVTSEGMEITL